MQLESFAIVLRARPNSELRGGGRGLIGKAVDCRAFTDYILQNQKFSVSGGASLGRRLEHFGLGRYPSLIVLRDRFSKTKLESLDLNYK
eukprot:2279465-Prymnesium_polylepis.1